MTFNLDGFDLDAFVRNTLAEDLGVGLSGGGRDVTSESVIPADARFAGVMDTRDAIEVAGLGVAGMAFALAAKDSLSNLFGGFTIFTDKPFSLKDRIKIGGFDGSVTEIGLRSTRLKTLDGRIVTIPNSKISDNSVENISSEPSRKVVVNLGLTYDMDDAKIERAMAVLREIAEEHKEDVEDDFAVGFNEFGDFALNVVFVYRITKGSDILGTQTSVNMAILKRFNAEGLEMAFPSQTIYNKSI